VEIQFGGYRVNRYVVQFGLGVVFLLFSIFATWYEGSDILEKQYEWKYSTPFSGLVLKESDISQLDFFVYAIKFKPTFPIVMSISSIYLLVLSGYYLFNMRKRIFTTYVSLIAALLFTLGWLMFTSTTSGAQALSYTFLSCGAICVVVSLLYHSAPFERRAVTNKR
jgi:hypothetical protein